MQSKDKLRAIILEILSSDKTTEEKTDRCLSALLPSHDDQMGICTEFTEMASGVKDEEAQFVLFHSFVMGRAYEQSHPKNFYTDLINTLKEISISISKIDIADRSLLDGKIQKLVIELSPNNIRDVEETAIVSLKSAMDIVRTAIDNDEGYRQGWVANIAMSIYDAIGTGGNDFSEHSEYLHKMCNKGAETFLKNLIQDSEN